MASVLQVSVLLIVLMFTFAICGVHLLGGKLARCNDPSPNITTRVSHVLVCSVFYFIVPF